VQYTDEAVVVIKLEPMKASNRKEEKTQVTHHKDDVTVISQKPMTDAKGGRDFKEYRKGSK